MDEKLEECLHEMVGSLRRCEHSYYVSLKYTRTVDVIKNLVERFITTLEFIPECLLLHKKEQDPSLEIPQFLIGKINLINEIVNDPEIKEALDFLLFLRKVKRAKYGKCEEFRRHVTMSVIVEGKNYDVNIDLLGEYYEQVSGYIKQIVMMITGNEIKS